MHGFDHNDASDDGTVFRDVLMLALLGFIMIVVLLIPHLNPPTKARESIASPGNIIVDVRWPADVSADVDLWVQAPGDRPVGYSNKGAKYFDLLRDDLGIASDNDGTNHEIAFARGAPPGEYTVNLHLYRTRTPDEPVSATVTISLRRGANGDLNTISKRKIALRHQGEEVTVARFSIDGEGTLVSGSVHDLPKALRNVSGDQ